VDADSGILVRARVIFAWQYMNVDWTSSADRMVHVKFSNTETWDYLKDWGTARIEADVQARIDRKNKEVSNWLATIPQDQKALCGYEQSDKTAALLTLSERALKASIPTDECDKIFWATAGTFAVPSDWKSQLYDDPLSVWQAMRLLAPWAVNPPLFLLCLGVALCWALSGFGCEL
jgi:hypothetical protein